MAYSFTGQEGGPISLETFKGWMTNYSSQQTQAFPNTTVIKGHFFGRDKIMHLLDEKDAVGIRVYYGVNDIGENTVILVAARSDWSDILPDDSGPGGPIILDDSFNCPPYCPK